MSRIKKVFSAPQKINDVKRFSEFNTKVSAGGLTGGLACQVLLFPFFY